MTAGSANRLRPISICAWASCGQSRIVDTWFVPPTQESARLSILMAELKLVRLSASVQFWTGRRISGLTVRSIPNTAMSSPTRMYLPSPYYLFGGRMLEELIERFNQLKTRSEDVRRYL